MNIRLLFSCIFLLASTAHAEPLGFSHVLSVQKTANGNFNVICSDTSMEEVSVEDLNSGNLCSHESPQLITGGHYNRTGGDLSACAQDIASVIVGANRVSGFTLLLCNDPIEQVLMSCEGAHCQGRHLLNRNFFSEVDITGKDKYTWTRTALDGSEPPVVATFEKGEGVFLGSKPRGMAGRKL